MRLQAENEFGVGIIAGFPVDCLEVATTVTDIDIACDILEHSSTLRQSVYANQRTHCQGG